MDFSGRMGAFTRGGEKRKNQRSLVCSAALCPSSISTSSNSSKDSQLAKKLVFYGETEDLFKKKKGCMISCNLELTFFS